MTDKAAVRTDADSTSVPPIAGDGLLHPVVLAAIGLLVINDHFLKAAWPGLVTGKLSDLAGLLFFPLLLQALWEVGLTVIGRPHAPSRLVLVVSIVVTAVVFSVVQLVPLAADAYSQLLGQAQWVVASLLGRAGSEPVPVQVTADPTDLIALPVLLLTYRIGKVHGADPAS